MCPMTLSAATPLGLLTEGGTHDVIQFTSVLRVKVKQGKSSIWLFLKIWLTISMESSWRDLFIDMVVDRFILKNNHITLYFCSTFIPKQVWDYLKQGIVFTVWRIPSFFTVYCSASLQGNAHCWAKHRQKLSSRRGIKFHGGRAPRGRKQFSQRKKSTFILHFSARSSRYAR